MLSRLLATVATHPLLVVAEVAYLLYRISQEDA